MHTAVNVNYHIQEDNQAFRFDADGVIGNLISPELIPTQVMAEDLRLSQEKLPRFDLDGVAFLRSPTKVTAFGDSDINAAGDGLTTYDQEIKALLHAELGAQEVIVFDHTVRIDDSKAVRRPARNVHTDYSATGAESRLVDIVGPERAEAFRHGGFGFVNVWRPIEHTIKSSPLGFIRATSMQARDWVDVQLIYPDRLGQILGVAANPDHEWFYLSDMKPDEAVLFNIYDNLGRPRLAHSALDLPQDSAAIVPRKSIETRTLVRYG